MSFQLTPTQQLVCNAMVASCQRDRRFINESRAGSGKTPITVVGAHTLQLPMVVVGLAATTGMDATWRDHCTRQGVSLVAYIGWEQLRGTSKAPLSHPYLHRVDHPDGSVAYEPTPAWHALVHSGVLLVTDELQRSKGDSLTNAALCALTRVIAAPSALCAVSATAMNRMENSKHICKVVLGGADLLDTCRRWDATTTERVLALTRQSTVYLDRKTGQPTESRKDALSVPRSDDLVCFLLYTQVVCKRLSAGVRQRFDDDPEVTLEYASMQYQLTENHADYRRALDRLARNQDADAAAEVEQFKYTLFIRAAKAELAANKQAKVLVLLNTRAAVEHIARELGAAVIMGGVPAAERQAIMARFNAPTNELRTLVGITTAMSEGLSFHDTTGQWPRTTFLSPTPVTTALAQGMFRTKRHGVKGRVRVYLVYGHSEGGYDEAKLMKRILLDSAVMAAVAPSQRADGVPLPGDLQTFVEDTTADGGTIMITDVEYQRRRELRTHQLKHTPPCLHADYPCVIPTAWPGFVLRSLDEHMRFQQAQSPSASLDDLATHAVVTHTLCVPEAAQALMQTRAHVHPGGDYDAVLHKAFHAHRALLLQLSRDPDVAVFPWHPSTAMPYPIVFNGRNYATLASVFRLLRPDTDIRSFTKQLFPSLVQLAQLKPDVRAFVSTLPVRVSFPDAAEREAKCLELGWRAVHTLLKSGAC